MTVTITTCSWCGKEGDEQYMYRQGEHDWFHARCAMKNAEEEMNFLMGSKK